MLNLVKQDCRSITVRNLRKIKLMVNQDVFVDANPHLSPYCTIPVNEKWRIALVDVKSGIREVANFTIEELDTINELACCNLYHICLLIKILAV